MLRAHGLRAARLDENVWQGWQRGFRDAGRRHSVMKVLDESPGGVQAGARLSLHDLALPVAGTGGVLLVFWKER